MLRNALRILLTEASDVKGTQTHYYNGKPAGQFGQQQSFADNQFNVRPPDITVNLMQRMASCNGIDGLINVPSFHAHIYWGAPKVGLGNGNISIICLFRNSHSSFFFWFKSAFISSLSFSLKQLAGFLFYLLIPFSTKYTSLSAAQFLICHWFGPVASKLFQSAQPGA